MKRGDVVLCVLPGRYGKARPVVVLQADEHLEAAIPDSVTVCPMTTFRDDALAFRVELKPEQNVEATGEHRWAVVMVDKAHTVPPEKIRERVGPYAGAQAARDRMQAMRIPESALFLILF